MGLHSYMRRSLPLGELAVGGGSLFHRWEPIHDDDLREQEQADGVHNNVALYDGTEKGAPVRWNFDQRWGGVCVCVCVRVCVHVCVCVCVF